MHTFRDSELPLSPPAIGRLQTTRGAPGTAFWATHRKGLQGPFRTQASAPKLTHYWKHLRRASTAPCRFVLKQERSAMAHQALEESLSHEKETTINRREKETPQRKR